MTKINNLNEIIEEKDGKYFLLKEDLSNCDLSGLDLSKIPMDVWKNAFFENTNFTGTNIQFWPQQLKKTKMNGKLRSAIWYDSYISLKNCNFTDCDLSYLSNEAFMMYSQVNVKLDGCNFTRTHLDVDLPSASDDSILDAPIYKNVIFSKEMEEKQDYSFYDLDLETLWNNPNLKVSSNTLLNIIQREFPCYYKVFTYPMIEEYYQKAMKCLTHDKDGFLVELYEKVKPYLTTPIAHIRFFQGIVENIHFNRMTFDDELFTKLLPIEFRNCQFDELFVSTKEEEYLNGLLNHRFLDFKECQFQHVYLPNISVDSFKKLKLQRLGNTPITFRRNLYVELGRACNMHGKFCCNQPLENCKYDLERIKAQLEQLAYYIHMDSIVLGVGESTLNIETLKDILYLIDRRHHAKSYIFTNGNMPFKNMLFEKLDEFDINLSLNISRDHYDSERNASIFGLSEKQIWNDTELEKIIADRSTTMCATCFQGELDTPEKLLEYIRYVSELGGENILFQTLHEDLKNVNENVVKSIDYNVFQEVIDMLVAQGFRKSIPIYSTGDYRLLILKNGKLNISFKQYITEQELQQEWFRAIKRTFDLSMDPSGEIYQNWHQSYGKVNVKTL